MIGFVNVLMEPGLTGLVLFLDFVNALAKPGLCEMETVLPFSALVKLMEPFYPQVGPQGGRLPYGLETMLRIHRDLHTCFNYGLGWTLSEFSFQPRCV